MSVPYKLEPCDINEVKHIEYRKSSKGCIRRDINATIEDFITSGHDCCRVCIAEDDRKAHFECTVLRRSVKLFNYDNVKVVLRGECVYLVKKDKWEEK